ncbi:hypothetical protein N0Y54_35630 [Nostoc punctiforme UO1]
MRVLRRLDCLLELSKEKVFKRYKVLEEGQSKKILITRIWIIIKLLLTVL